MFNKRGQISVFIIIGIVLVAIASTAFFFVSSINEKSFNGENLGDPSDTASVKQYYEACGNDASISGIYLLARNGGHIYGYDAVLFTEKEAIAYHLNNDEEVGPNEHFMKTELEKFIKDSFIVCLNDFSSFRDYFNFEYDEIDAEVSINENNVIVTIDYPIEVIQQNKKTKISEFNHKYGIRLGYIIDIKDELIALTKNNDKIVLDELTRYDAQINIMPYDQSTAVYSIHDKKSDIDGVPFVFNFGVKQQFVENEAPTVEEIGEQTAYVDQQFVYKIKASDPESDKLIYEDETVLFDIDAYGKISFRPTPANVGHYEFPIRISDGSNTVIKILKLNIKKQNQDE